MIPTGNTCAEPLKSCKLYGSANAQITLGSAKSRQRKFEGPVEHMMDDALASVPSHLWVRAHCGLECAECVQVVWFEGNMGGQHRRASSPAALPLL